jgi:hypothetical protein
MFRTFRICCMESSGGGVNDLDRLRGRLLPLTTLEVESSTSLRAISATSASLSSSVSSKLVTRVREILDIYSSWNNSRRSTWIHCVHPDAKTRHWDVRPAGRTFIWHMKGMTYLRSISVCLVHSGRSLPSRCLAFRLFLGVPEEASETSSSSEFSSEDRATCSTIHTSVPLKINQKVGRTRPLSVYPVSSNPWRSYFGCGGRTHLLYLVPISCLSLQVTLPASRRRMPHSGLYHWPGDSLGEGEGEEA